jgi:hypothetical protein
MANVCGTSLHVCRIRATRLDDNGNVAAPPNNVAVSDSAVSVTVTPNVEAGVDISLKNGCDCIVAAYLGADQKKGYNLEFAKSKIEPAAEEILLGATVISDGADQIGYWSRGIGECGEAAPSAAFEFWTDVWVGNAQDGTRPNIHHVFPQSTWVEGGNTYGNEFATPTLSGKAVANPNWGMGPHGDQPEAAPANSSYGLYYTDEPMPDAACGYDDVTPAS